MHELSRYIRVTLAGLYSYMMPIVKWDKTLQEELSTGWSREIEHGLAAK